ncbi:MAG: type IV pili twitching motility protein PilT, partial [Synechocystis sp.]
MTQSPRHSVHPLPPLPTPGERHAPPAQESMAPETQFMMAPPPVSPPLNRQAPPPMQSASPVAHATIGRSPGQPSL